MTSTISKYFKEKASSKRKVLSSASSNSDSCLSPEQRSDRDKQEKKKPRRESVNSDEETMSSEDPLEEIREKLCNMSTKDDIRQIFDEMKQIREDMKKMADKLNTRIDKLEGDIFDMKSERDTLTAEVGRLREENKELRGLVQQSKREDGELRRAVNDNEQHGRQYNVRVYGVPEMKEATETVDDCIKQCTDIFTKKVGVKVSAENIEIAHRVGKPGGNRPRPIIVRFVSRRLRGQVLADRRKLKQSGVSVGEDLTQLNYRLMKKATDHSATMAVWSSNGKILAKTKNNKTLKLDITMNVNEVLSKAMA